MLFLRLIGESFGFAWAALRENKTRTLLSLLGVTIGIMTIIGVFSAVDTLRANLESSVDKLGRKSLYVQKWPWIGDEDTPWWKIANRPYPTYAEYDRIRTRMVTAESVAFGVNYGSRTAKWMNNTVSGITMIGATHEYYGIRNLEIVQGRYFTELESKRGANVVVIGSTIAEGLFPNQDPIGKSVTLMGRKFVVIGTFEKEGDGIQMDVSVDDIALIPYQLMRSLINVRNHGAYIIVNASSGVALEEAESELQGLMRSMRRLSPQDEDNFQINKTTVITAQMDMVFVMVNLAGAIIGGFSILVGGFGIANIMFVSVRERTSIIGIQKSLGAKNYFILSQFLIEAVVLCLIGGIVGLGLVYLLAFGAKALFDLTIVVSMSMVIMTLVLSTMIGVIAGIVPAMMAARLDPVEAIRSK